MNRVEFDQWYSINYDRLVGLLSKKYPRCEVAIHEDMSDFYIMVHEKGAEVFRDIESYLYTYIYNRYYRFKKLSPDYIVNKTRLSIKLVDVLPEANAELDEEWREELHRVLESVLAELPLDSQTLYKLYFEQGLVSREIGLLLGCGNSRVAKSVRELKALIKTQIENRYGKL